MRKFFTFDGTGEKVVFVEKFENDHSALADAINLSGVSLVNVCEILPDGEIKVAHSWDDEPSSEAADEPWDGFNSDAEADADVDNPETATKREHISRSVEIKVEDIDLGSQTGEL